jgi:hypothetical protein
LQKRRRSWIAASFAQGRLHDGACGAALAHVVGVARIERPQAAGPDIGGNRVTILSPPPN